MIHKLPYQGEIMPVKIPLGISDFKTIIEERYYYIDKTIFIEELERSNGQVMLIPRPRRFGKTLNLSMLQYFYEVSTESNAYLFENAAIWKKANFRKLQGTHPVIFLSFGRCEDRNRDIMLSDIKEVIVQEFRRHYDNLKSSLSNPDVQDYIDIKDRKTCTTHYTNSLKFLTQLLQQKYQQKVIILIDEYATPTHTAYLNGFYREVHNFMQTLFSGAFNNNSFLAHGVVTGLMRTNKESIFSGINNLKINNQFDGSFSDTFGFNNWEVNQLLSDAKLTKNITKIKQWCYSYDCGKKALFNPWHLLECIDNDGDFGSCESQTREFKHA